MESSVGVVYGDRPRAGVDPPSVVLYQNPTMEELVTQCLRGEFKGGGVLSSNGFFTFYAGSTVRHRHVVAQKAALLGASAIWVWVYRTEDGIGLAAHPGAPRPATADMIQALAVPHASVFREYGKVMIYSRQPPYPAVTSRYQPGGWTGD